ncbi:MAG: class I SAM-dependent methyltransferase [Pseudomonadota bacterium]
MDYDQTAAAAVYDRARAYGRDAETLWRRVVVDSVAGVDVQTVLDLGCGTGRYSARLADWLSADIIGVDPSTTMLDRARRNVSSNRVRFVSGPAEDIPLPDGGVDLVFISMALHHFRDRGAAVAECRRVLRPEGRLCLRAGTTDQSLRYPYLPFFPEAGTLWNSTLLSAEATRSCFEEGGFRQIEHKIVESRVADDWPEFAKKIALRADSTLIQLDDEAFERGLADLRAYSDTPDAVGPVIEPIDCFVFDRNDLAADETSATA